MGASQSNTSKPFRHNDGGYQVTFEREPFAEGGCRWAFRGKLKGASGAVGSSGRALSAGKENDGRRIVVKVFKPKYTMQAEQWAPDIKASLDAGELARRFNKAGLANKAIFFIKPSVIQIKHLEGFVYLGLIRRQRRSRRFRADEYIIMEYFLYGEYVKFLGNNGYINPDEESITMQCFSHWTYHITNGDMMVTDLQGVREDTRFILTDPAIHSRSQKYGATDLGLEGMALFFETHKCSALCRRFKRLRRHSFNRPVTAASSTSSTYSWQMNDIRRHNQQHRQALAAIGE